MSELYVPRIAILASGNGSTAEVCAKAIHDHELRAEIGLVISDKKDAKVLERVPRWNKEWGFATEMAVINQETHPEGEQERGQTLAESEAICNLLRTRGIGLVAYFGYMRIAGGPLIAQYGFLPGIHTSMYQARSLNVHPAPLPLTADTYGWRASRKALEAYRAGLIKESKTTVHVVAAEIDMGPKVAEHSVEIKPDDDPHALFARAQGVEKKFVVGDIAKFLSEQQKYRQLHERFVP